MKCKKGKVTDNAVTLYVPSLKLLNHVGLVHEQFRYIAVLRAIKNKEVSVLSNDISGVEGHSYVVLPPNTTDHHGRPIQSHVIAVISSAIVIIDETIHEIDIPIEQHKTQDLRIIRLLTSWVDGFAAFTTGD